MRARSAVPDQTRCRQPSAGGGIFSSHARPSHPLPRRMTLAGHVLPSATIRHDIVLQYECAGKPLLPGRVWTMSDLVRLEYRNVSMRFAAASGKALAAVERVSFAVRDGEVVSLIGPSGCGKSTLLNIGSGLYTPSEGEAFVDGERVQGPNAHVAFMLQKDLLLPWRTVLENVMFGVEIQRLALPERRRRAHALLENFNLAEFAGHYPHQLSGGMRQRVALARTLAVDPSVLLLDEPFSAVDAQTRMALQRELAQTLKRAGKTALLITHDLLEAVTLSDRVLVMSRRPGRIIDEIVIDIPDRDEPLKRRLHPKVNDYVNRLMDRLDISHAGQDAVGASA